MPKYVRKYYFESHTKPAPDNYNKTISVISLINKLIDHITIYVRN